VNGIHDMGGMHGFGRSSRSETSPVFHSDWEARVLALNRALGYARAWNIDMSRAAIEELPPDIYLTRSYYEKGRCGWSGSCSISSSSMRTKSRPAGRCDPAAAAAQA